MKIFRIGGFILGVALIVTSLWMSYVQMRPDVFYPVTKPTNSVSDQTPSVTPKAIDTAVVPTKTVVPTLTVKVTSTAIVRGNILDNQINLAGGQSTALSISLPEGGELRSTWAKAIWAKPEDVDCLPGGKVYCPDSPYAHTIYGSYSDKGSVTVIRAHSGIIGLQELFGETLDKYLRITDGKPITLAEGEMKLAKLFDQPAYLCQVDQAMPDLAAFTDNDCPGRKVKLLVRAAMIVVQPDTTAYDVALTESGLAWLADKNPDFLFSESSDGFLFSTCVERFSDQTKVSGIHDYSFNRVAVWFEVVP